MTPALWLAAPVRARPSAGDRLTAGRLLLTAGRVHGQQDSGGQWGMSMSFWFLQFWRREELMTMEAQDEGRRSARTSSSRHDDRENQWVWPRGPQGPTRSLQSHPQLQCTSVTSESSADDLLHQGLTPDDQQKQNVLNLTCCSCINLVSLWLKSISDKKKNLNNGQTRDVWFCNTFILCVMKGASAFKLWRV